MQTSQKQFDYLATMGISLWQARDGFFDDTRANKAVANKVETTTKSDGISPNKGPLGLSETSVQDKTPKNRLKSTLKKTLNHQDDATASLNKRAFESVDEAINQPFIKDILLALNLNDNQVTLTDDGLRLGKLQWHIGDKQACELKHHELFTSNINELCKNAKHKAQLWGCLSHYLNQQ